MRDPVLHESIKELIVRCSELLAKWSNEGRLVVPERIAPKITFGEDGSIQLDQVVESDSGAVAARSLHDLLRDPVVAGVVERLLEHQEIVRLLHDKKVAVVPMAFGYNVLQPFLTRQLLLQGRFVFEDQAFEDNYRDLEMYLYGSEDKYLLVAPLANFGMKAENERVGPLTIRRMNEDEFAAYNGITADPLSMTRAGVPDWYRFVVESEVSVPRGSAPLRSIDQDRFWWLEALMKLVKVGSVTYSMIWVKPLSLTGMSFRSGSIFPRQTRIGKPYTLDEADSAELRHYWALAEPFIGKQPPFWMIALQRFSEGVDRLRLDEALVDYWIACESLFGDDVEMGELTYKLSLRMAQFLGGTPSERATLREAAKDAYRGRGALLHGSRKLDAARLATQTSTMEDATRRALRKCILDAYPSREEMIGRIERSILGEPSS